MKLDTALRGETLRLISNLGSADVLIGIPCFNNEDTLAHVMRMVSQGLATHYDELKSVIMVADGGSTDDTREVAEDVELPPGQQRLVSIYRGLPGKGSALRSVFEAADRLEVSVCGMVDSDLRSITPDWVKYLLDPVLEGGYQYVAPTYVRHKYDGTITNNVVYNMTRALYGKRIRQPIGGDFAIAREVARYYTEQDVWHTDVARFGIDIWMTTSAVVQGFRVCQSNLGVKIHDVKDPGQDLGPMFCQVVSALMSLTEQYEDQWRAVRGSEPVETFGFEGTLEPESVEVSLDRMIERFRAGHQQHSKLWGTIFSPACVEGINKAVGQEADSFHLPTELWVMILYELAAAYREWGGDRRQLLEAIIPLYLARVASFVGETEGMSSVEAETLIETQAEAFEAKKDYLLEVWDRRSV